MNKNKNKNVLILSTFPLDNDPRILREINWLKDTHKVSALSSAPSKIEGVEHYTYKQRPSPPSQKIKNLYRHLVKDYESVYWRDELRNVVDAMKANSFSRIIANDFDTLPIAFAVADEETKILFDAHEYAPQHFEDQLQWRLFVQPIAIDICQKYIPNVDYAWTVCQGLADKYEKNFGKKFDVITNSPDFVDQRPSETDPDKIRMIYHGMATESRKTHRQIEMMELLDERFELNLMLVGDSPYVRRLRKMAEGKENVNFLPPVETADIAKFTNQFDIGLFLIPPVNPNYKYILPNKFFEFIQARLAVAIGPSVEMKRIVEEFDLGVIADDFTPERMASKINDLSVEKIRHFKIQSDECAYELSADSNRDKFLSMVESE